MQKVTSTKLGNHFDNLITDLTAGGRYQNASEAIREGLRLLEEKEAKYLTKLEVLRQALIEGEKSGESTKTHAEIIAEAKAELHER